MNFFSGKLATVATVAAGAILATLTFTSPVKAADDLPIVGDIPMPEVHVDVRIGDERRFAPPLPLPSYRPAVAYPRGPFAAIPPARYEADIIDQPSVSPYQVAVMLRSTGYSLLGGINRRGWVYTVAVLNPRGDDGRAIIDARTGAIIRFIPAFALNARLNDQLGVIYGPPGPPPIPDFRPSLRPPLAVPRAAKRDAPKVASRSAPALPTETKATPAPDAKPATIELQPTKDLPAVQSLD